MIDASQVKAFERKLHNAASIAEREADEFQEHWGERLVGEMQSIVEVDTGTLRDSIDQVEPGGIFIGAPYWRFLEYGTSRMGPRPFIRPAIKQIQTPAEKDAADRGIRWIQRGT